MHDLKCLAALDVHPACLSFLNYCAAVGAFPTFTDDVEAGKKTQPSDFCIVAGLIHQISTFSHATLHLLTALVYLRPQQSICSN